MLVYDQKNKCGCSKRSPKGSPAPAPAAPSQAKPAPDEDMSFAKRECSVNLRRTSISLAAGGAAHVAHEGVESAEPAEGYSLAAQAARQAEIKMLKGVHPYRILLSDVVKRLRNTKTRMQALLSGVKPDDHEPWCVPT